MRPIFVFSLSVGLLRLYSLCMTKHSEHPKLIVGVTDDQFGFDIYKVNFLANR